jgi:hypothetical protein
MTEISYKTQTEHPFFREGLKSKYEDNRWKAKTSLSFSRGSRVFELRCVETNTPYYLGLLLPRMKNISVQIKAKA